MIEIIISIFILSGSLFILIASIGIFRFKDLYSRIHAVTKASSLGVVLLLISAVLYFSSSVVIVKSLLITIFIFLTSPLSAHTIIKSYKDKEKQS